MALHQVFKIASDDEEYAQKIEIAVDRLKNTISQPKKIIFF